MANQTTLFYEKCRLCLDTRGSHNVVDDHNDLQRDIFIHAGIKVKSKDNLPQKVCTICLDIINKAKDLRRVALKNDSYLRILFEDELGNDSEQSNASTVTLNDEENKNQNNNSSKSCEQHNEINNLSPIQSSEKILRISVRKDLFLTSTPLPEPPQTDLPLQETSRTDPPPESPQTEPPPSKPFQTEPVPSKPPQIEPLPSKPSQIEQRSSEPHRTELPQQKPSSILPEQQPSTSADSSHCVSSSSSVKKKKKKSKKKRRKSMEENIETNEKTQGISFKVRLVEPYKHRGLKVKIKRANRLDFECDVCSKNFETHKKLYLHQRQHNKNILCPIDVCGKKFPTKADLAKHVRTHTGEKPYKCNICEKAFTQGGSLKQHKENIHFEFSK